MVSTPCRATAPQALTAWPPALIVGATRSARVHERAHDPDERAEAVGTTARLNSSGSAPPRVVGLSPCLAVRALKARRQPTAVSTLKSLVTRSRQSTAHSCMVGTVTVMSSAKRRYMSITHTASRAADSATIAIGRASHFSRERKGVNLCDSLGLPPWPAHRLSSFLSSHSFLAVSLRKLHARAPS